MTETPRNEEQTPEPDPSAPGAMAPGTTSADTAPRDSGTAPAARDPLRSSLTGRAWVSVVALGIVLVLLIVFIAQNTETVSVSFLGWKGHAPLAVALLIATAAGLFLAAVAGTLRIWQLRRRVRRETKRHR